MQNKENFGECIRRLREKRNLPIRKIASVLDIYASTLSKIERNERKANRLIIKQMADIFEITQKELLLIFLSDKVAYELMGKENAEEILKVAEEKVAYLKSKKPNS